MLLTEHIENSFFEGSTVGEWSKGLHNANKIIGHLKVQSFSHEADAFLSRVFILEMYAALVK